VTVETENNPPAAESQPTPEQTETSDTVQQDQSATAAPAESPPDSDVNTDYTNTSDQTQPETDQTSPQPDHSVTNPEPADSENDNLPENLNRILNIKVPIIVQIAKKKLKVSEIMKLNIGTVIQFDQDAYQFIELMVNNEIIGLGQPVKIGEKFGLKITQIGDISETIKRLGGQN